MSRDPGFIETADEYGRQEGCFVDHARPTFSFKHCSNLLRDSRELADAQGLVGVPGLRAGSLPSSTFHTDFVECLDIDGSTLVDHDSHRLLEDPRSFSRPSPRELKDLLLEVVDLGTNDEDVHEYQRMISAKRCCKVLDHWLPMVSLPPDQHIGSECSLRSQRFQALLKRELEAERICVAYDASTTCLTENPDVYHIAHSQLCHEQALPIELPGLLSQPLSPISDCSAGFIPDRSITFFDLTSEPSSPSPTDITTQTREELSTDYMATHTGLGPLAKSPPFEYGTTLKSRDLSLDVPMILSSSGSDGSLDEQLSTHFGIAHDHGSLYELDHASDTGFFGEALAAVMVSNQVSKMAEQEQFDATETLSRMHVPIMDFSTPELPWASHVCSSRAHLSWLQSHHHFTIPADSSYELDDRAYEFGLQQLLSIATDQSVYEELELSSQPAYQLHDMSPVIIRSTPCLNIGSSRAIFQVSEETLLEDLAPDPVDEQWSFLAKSKQRYTTSAYFPAVEAEQHSKSLVPRHVHSLLPSNHTTMSTAEPLGALPLAHDEDMTGKLLSSFMELRAVKPRPSRPTQMARIHHSSASSQTISLNEVSQHTSDTAIQSDLLTAKPAPTPKYAVPEEKGYFIVSLKLPQKVLRHIETVWPEDHLIDRDFMAAGIDLEAKLPSTNSKSDLLLSCEPDLILTPNVGLIITTLLSVRQKPLPGSTSLPEIRARTLKLIQKYETLIVLVSESNSSGEYVGSPTPSEVAAYSDFVRFTVALQAGVVVYYVPGAAITIAEWIVAFMCQFSSCAVSDRRLISSQESSWELFLRRIGMNVASAQILSTLLFEELGAAGLARFVVMSTEESISRYSHILGGSKSLLAAKRVFSEGWGMGLTYPLEQQQKHD